mmetsp:Transcript_17621/g.43979  ORF Transcript_17621/g.43979 Transcript_17621/m.43979 type:complete len:374 (-) Transcript_17621:1842-2963(-)
MKKSISRRFFATGVCSLVLALLLATGVDAHARMECPPPLSGMTGEKTGPCDVEADDGSVPAFSLKPNALNTVTWLESLSHPGAPVRFALSREGISLDEPEAGFETCLLLDHVPHDALSSPTFQDASTWHRSTITLWIPDIKCERCYLQLISVMSDAIHGVPADTKCAYKGALTNDESLDYPACPAVYHSCSPISIDGTIPRNDVEMCNTTEFEEQLEWPLTPRDDPNLYEHSIYFNRGDVGLYSTTDARLLSIGSPLIDATCTNPLYCDPEISFEEVLGIPEDAAYTSLEGSCAPVVETMVARYQPGGYLNGVSDSENTIASSPIDSPLPPATDASANVASVSSGCADIPSPSIIHSTTMCLTLLMSLFLLER